MNQVSLSPNYLTPGSIKNKLVTRLTLWICILVSTTFLNNLQAQLTGIKSIPGDYATITLAVADLNTVGVGAGGVVFNVAANYTETISATISLTATGTMANPITFQKSGAGTNPRITSYTGGVGTPGSAIQDGIFQFVGSDYVTIDGIDLSENAANSTNPATMEYGYGMYKANATNGCQNNTIKNCVITLNRINNATGSGPAVDGSRGIDVVNALPTTATTVVTVTAASGSNSNNKFYSNTIQNCNIGIALIGFADITPFALADTGNDIGGAAAGTGNIIKNYGGAPAAVNPAAAVRTLAQYGLNVSFNTINNNDGSGVNHVSTLRGIYLNTATSASETINNNSITIKGGGTTSQLTAIENVAGSTAASNTININTNTITGCTYTTATSGVFYGIFNNAATPATLNITNNTFGSNSTAATSGSYYAYYNTGGVVTALNFNNNSISSVSFTAAATSLIFRGIYVSSAGTTCAVSVSTNTYSSIVFNGTATGEFEFIYAAVTTGSYMITNNTLSGSITLPTTGTVYMIYNSQSTGPVTVTGNNLTGAGFTKTGAGGTVYGYYNFGVPTGTETLSNNTVSNVTVTGATTLYGLYFATNTTEVELCKNNIITNFTGGTSTIEGIHFGYGAAGSEISGNTVSNINGAGIVTGISIVSTASISLTVFNNNINNLTSTGASLVTGLAHTAGTSTTIFKNKIYGLKANNAGGTVFGMTVTAGTLVTIFNNLIGQLTAPITSNTDAVRGISITSVTATTTINVYYNTIYINAQSSGVNFGSTGIYHTANATATTVALDLRNNIIVNNSTPNGTGFTVAFRRSLATLANYATTSNNNLFWAGGTGACTTRFIYHDGTTGYQMAPFQAAVTPRETVSVTEDPPFISTTGSLATFLHVNPAIATQIESGAATIGTITDDFDGNVRSVTPDIGADEYSGIADVACAGTPTAGTATASPAALCSGLSTMICVSGQTPPTGITIQWQSSLTSGGPYSDIVCANGSCYSTPNLAPGTYYYRAVVTCTNSGLSAASNQVTVVVNPSPVVMVTPPSPIICSNSSVMLTASGAATYSWSPSTGLNTTSGAVVIASPTVTTTYTVTGMDAVGCTGTTNVTVSVIPAPSVTASATPSSICFGGSSQLLATNTGVSTVNQYSFSAGTGTTLDPMAGATQVLAPNDDDTPTAAPVNIGFTFKYEGVNYTQYSVSPDGWILLGPAVASSQFTNAVTSTINIPKIYPYWDDLATGIDGNVKVLVTGVSPNQIFIVQWFITIPRNLTGNANSTFQAWLYENTSKIEFRYGTMGVPNSGSISGGLTGASATNFNSLTFSTNTSSSTTANDLNTIAPPSGTIYTYLPPSVTFSWSPATFLNNPNIANPLASGVTSMTAYTVTELSGNGCTATASVTVTPGPIVSISETDNSGIANNDRIICAGASAMLTASGGTSYSWSNGANTASTTVMPGGTTTYTVTVTDANACTATSTATITVNPLPAPVIAVTPANTVCTPQTITLNAGPGYSSYLWTGGAITQTITVSTVGTSTYNVTVTDANGCSGSSSATVTINQTPGLSETNVAPTDCFSNNGSIDLTVTPAGTYTYNWTTPTGMGLINGQQDQNGLSVGTYNVTVTNSVGGCFATLSVTLSVPGGCGGCDPVGSVTVSPALICPGSTATFTGVGTLPGATFAWFDAPTGGMQVGTGNPFTSGPLNTTTTYCIEQTIVVPNDVTFEYTGSTQTFIVPTGVTSISVQAWGAQGGNVNSGGGGLGGFSSGTLTVVPGQTLYVSVGGQGGTPTAGFNGGGLGGLGAPTGGGGGGASDVRNGAGGFADRQIIAGGGGGAGMAATNIPGGPGGGTTGTAGTNGSTAVAGGGGTQLIGGAGGSGGGSGADGSPGVLGVGGAGAPELSFLTNGGGGGGGYYGGGGGEAGEAGTTGSGGGGGSGYIGGVTGGSTFNSIHSGNGQIKFSFLGPCTSLRTCGTVVVDNLPPVITCPTSVTVQCASLVPPSNFQGVTATDNSGLPVILTLVSDVISNITCFNRFTVTRTYRATDFCLNSATCSQTIAVLDNTPPAMTCPPGIIVQCASQVPTPNVQLVTATDNCGGATTISFVSDVISNQTCVNRFNVTRTYRATDACGNSGTCSQIISVFDNTVPTLTCPAPLTVQCASLVPTANPSLVITSDNCGGGATVTFVNDVISNQTCANRFLVTRTYRSTDACGNSATCTQIITVFDNTPPTITCPAAVTVQCANLVPAVNTAGVVTADNCVGTPTVTFVSDVITNQTCVNRFTLTRMYRSTDACGNSSTCTQIITVFDNTPPTITFTDPLLQGVPNGGTFNVQCQGQDPNWSLPTFSTGSISATDNCNGSVNITYSEVLQSEGNCSVDGYIDLFRLKWTAVDACGNSSAVTIFMKLVDLIPPVIHNVPDDITVNCNQVPDPPSDVYATDECLCACVLQYHQSTPAPGCQDGQVITRSWTAQDDCGNVKVDVQHITLTDKEGPVLQITQPELAGATNGSVYNYTCNEGGIPDFYDQLGVGSVYSPPSCGGPPTITFESFENRSVNCERDGYMEQQSYHWTGVDQCGNVTNLTIFAQLVDNEPPVLTNVPDVACVDDPALNNIDATDNCGNPHIRFWDIPIPNPCGSGKAYRRTYEAFDDCGNMTRDTVILIPNDQGGPVLKFVNPVLAALHPGEILIIDCASNNGQYTTFSAADVSIQDGCPFGSNVTFTENVLETQDCSQNGILAILDLEWSATDICGNESTLSVTAHVVDHTPPVLVNFQPVVTIGCNDEPPSVSAIDNCGLAEVTISETIIPGPCAYEYDIHRDITATDPCGNSTNQMQTIHVGNGNGPVIEGVVDQICDDLSTPNVTAYDSCAGEFINVTMTEKQLDSDCRDGLVIERTWTAVDACGHVSVKKQIIILNDNTPPEIQIPTYSIIRKFLDNGYNLVYLSQTGIILALNALDENSVTATDDCDTDITPTFSLDVTYSGNCQADGYFERRVYTWVATDACGNSSSISFSVDIMDDVPPVIVGVPNDATIVCQPLPPVPPVNAIDAAQPVTIVYTQTINPDNGQGEFDVIRKWVATDACGNTSEATQKITWIPNTFLECEIEMPASVPCNSHGVPISSAVSGGLGNVSYSWEIFGEECFIQSGQGTPGITIYVGWSEVEVLLTVTDAYGCSSVCSGFLDCTIPGPNPIVVNPQVINPKTISDPGSATITDQRMDGYLTKLNLWPNPANGSLSLGFDSYVDQPVQFRLINFLGQTSLSEKINAIKGNNTQKIDISLISEGSYLVEVKTQKEMYTKVVVILRHE